MKKIALLLCLFAIIGTAYADEQVYFKIAVNDSEYSTFLTDKVRTHKETLKYLASRMRHTTFSPEVINDEYYKVVRRDGIKYFERDAVQYDIVPVFNDRFRQVVLVDAADGTVLRKETYDMDGKLVFSFASLEKGGIASEQTMQNVIHEKFKDFYKGYYVESDRELKDGTKHISLNDGINRFSIFKKKIDFPEPFEDKRILYGNYVYRHIIGDELFTVVGTLPFSEMENFLNSYVRLEDKK